MNKINRLISIPLLLTITLSACGNNQNADPATHENAEHANQTHVAGDIREAAASKETLPTFLKDFDPQISAVYAAVPDHHEMLQYMPCYCGCGESVGHKSNLECFIHEMKADGSLTWDSHGTTCNTCLAIAAEAITMQNEGKSVKEIRDVIDQKYKEGFAAPTVTPMPPEAVK